MINHYFFIFTAEDDAATQWPRRGQGSRGGRRSGSRSCGCGRRGRGADESESPPPVASTAAMKKDKEGPRFPPEPPPTLLLTEQDHTEAEKIRTGHQDREEDVSAFDAYNQVVVKAELLRTAIIVMGANASRKVDTYTIRVRNPWGIAFSSQVQIVCILPHQLDPGETQPHIVVKSLTDAVTGADALDDMFQDNPELVPEIPTELF